MREYAKVRPKFWTQGTGKKLRDDRDAREAALYLMTAPGSHMTGLYQLALPTLAHHLNLPTEGAREALRRLSQEGYARFDEDAELVFVTNMAREQVGKSLKPRDNQIKAIEKYITTYAGHPFFNDFIRLYGRAYHLSLKPVPTPYEGPTEGPSDPLRSQEQEQEQEDLPPPPPADLSRAIGGGGGEGEPLTERAERRQLWRRGWIRVVHERHEVFPVEHGAGDHLRALTEWSLSSGLTDDQCRLVLERFAADTDSKVLEAQHWVGFLSARAARYLAGDGARPKLPHQQIVDPAEIL